MKRATGFTAVYRQDYRIKFGVDGWQVRPWFGYLVAFEE
jgi:hypothetical protein